MFGTIGKYIRKPVVRFVVRPNAVKNNAKNFFVSKNNMYMHIDGLSSSAMYAHADIIRSLFPEGYVILDNVRYSF